jgi:hypothetical protein
VLALTAGAVLITRRGLRGQPTLLAVRGSVSCSVTSRCWTVAPARRR